MKFPSEGPVVFSSFAPKKPETDRNDLSKVTHTSDHGS